MLQSRTTACASNVIIPPERLAAFISRRRRVASSARCACTYGSHNFLQRIHRVCHSPTQTGTAPGCATWRLVAELQQPTHTFTQQPASATVTRQSIINCSTPGVVIPHADRGSDACWAASPTKGHRTPILQTVPGHVLGEPISTEARGDQRSGRRSAVSVRAGQRNMTCRLDEVPEAAKLYSSSQWRDGDR